MIYTVIYRIHPPESRSLVQAITSDYVGYSRFVEKGLVLHVLYIEEKRILNHYEY